MATDPTNRAAARYGKRTLAQEAIMKLFLSVMMCVGLMATANDRAYPEARRGETLDHYHGQAVADPYRWMEDLESPELQAWLAAQDKLLRSFVDEEPLRTRLHQRIKELSSVERFSLPMKAGDAVYYTRTAPGEVRPTLLVARGDEEQVLMQPDAFIFGDEDQLKTWSVSPDGRYLVYKTAVGQSRWGTLHVVALAEHKLVDRIRAYYGNSSPIWRKDGSSFFYVRYDAPLPGSETTSAVTGARVVQRMIGGGERLLHTTPDQPSNVFGASVARDDRALYIIERDSRKQGGSLFYLNLETREKTQLFHTDANIRFVGANGDKLRLLTDHNAGRGRVVEVSLAQPHPNHWQELVGESGATIQSVTESGDYLVVRASQDADFTMKVYPLTGGKAADVALPHAGWSWSMGGTPHDENGVYFSLNGLYNPGATFYLNLETRDVTLFKRQSLPLNPEAYTMKQVFYKSADGTRVPMFIAHRKDVSPGPQSKVFMYGYGAYKWSAYPWFQPHWAAWMDMGGIFALPGVRGGGEYGEAWHQAGIKTQKQNGVDDFIAAARYLVAQGYTSKGGIVANGGSASGVLAAAAAMQQPTLFGAAVIEIPTLDLMRFDRDPAGRYRVAEYGSPENPEEFASLRKLSPVHNVEPGACYPPMIIHVGSKDQVALPWHGYKYTAALQQGIGCDHPVLLRVSKGAGHALGLTPDQSAKATADQLTFLVRTLGMQVPTQIAAH